MSYINNFDQSSTGTNVEIILQYDTDHHEARESLDLMSDGIIFYSQYGEKSLDDDTQVTLCGDTVREQKRLAIKFITDHFFTCSFELLSFDNKREIAAHFKWYLSKGYSILDVIKDEYIAKDGVENVMRPNRQWGGSQYYTSEWHLYLENDIFEVNYDITEIRGYSQGDYHEVLYIIDKNLPATTNESTMRDHFCNLLYDSPVYGRIEITGNGIIGIEEIYIDEYLDDRYRWDKDGFVTKFKDSDTAKTIGDDVVNQVIDLLPSELEYE